MTTKQDALAHTPAELIEAILRDGERLLAVKHKRPAPVWPTTPAVRDAAHLARLAESRERDAMSEGLANSEPHGAELH